MYDCNEWRLMGGHEVGEDARRGWRRRNAWEGVQWCLGETILFERAEIRREKRRSIILKVEQEED